MLSLEKAGGVCCGETEEELSQAAQVNAQRWERDGESMQL